MRMRRTMRKMRMMRIGTETRIHPGRGLIKVAGMITRGTTMTTGATMAGVTSKRITHVRAILKSGSGQDGDSKSLMAILVDTAAATDPHLLTHVRTPLLLTLPCADKQRKQQLSVE
jgi:hypothetical protein